MLTLGSILATFIFFGVPANHLIAASVMAAPGALGFAKLLLPETHCSKTTWETVKNAPKPYVLNHPHLIDRKIRFCIRINVLKS